MIAFTQQEKKVILFLLTMILAGAGINLLVKLNSPAKKVILLTQDIGKVNLNTANQKLLVQVPGIGDKLAQRIVEYRLKNGAFQDTQALKKIKGITAYRYEKIKDLFLVD